MKIVCGAVAQNIPAARETAAPLPRRERLPTEAEWEKAARGGLAGKRFPWGDTISQRDANFFNAVEEAYETGNAHFHPAYKTGERPYTSPVGSFPANGYGLHDMTGNVWEWCWDRHGDYPATLETDPRGATEGLIRVRRGGSWGSGGNHCRIAYRDNFRPDLSHLHLGFRLARSAAP